LADTRRNSIAAKLWRLPGQFLVAMINATAILTIVAAVLALAALSRLEGLAETVASTMTDAVLARVVPEPRQALAGLVDLRAELESLGASLRIKAGQGDAPLEGNIERVRLLLTSLRESIDRLTKAKVHLTDEALARAAAAAVGALTDRNECSTALMSGESDAYSRIWPSENAGRRISP
jgi:hypothetical protein